MGPPACPYHRGQQLKPRASWQLAQRSDERRPIPASPSIVRNVTNGSPVRNATRGLAPDRQTFITFGRLTCVVADLCFGEHRTNTLNNVCLPAFGLGSSGTARQGKAGSFEGTLPRLFYFEAT